MDVTRDESYRYVLPAESAYLANLAVLWSRFPALAAAVEAIGDTPAYAATASRCGLPTLAAPTPDGRSLWLHSRYEPAKEADQQVSAFPGVDRDVIFVFGLGLGYHLQALHARAPGATLFVVETDLSLIQSAMWARDCSTLLASERVHLLWQPDKSQLFATLQPHLAAVHLGSATFEHPPSVQRSPEAFAAMRTWIDEFIEFGKTTVNTLILNGRKTSENVAANLPWYVASPSVDRLKNAYAGHPAIIVSAGPSLRKNKHLLAGAAGRAVTIAVQTTLRPLLDAGVEPHFVTSLDYHEISTRFFENLPGDVKTELVAEPKATDRIFAMHPGPLTLNGNDFADKLLREQRPSHAALPAGATVAHLAYYLAEHLGCDPIIFVGQDLGFSEGLCYSPGTSYDDVWRPELGRFCSAEMKQWEQIVRDRPILRRVADQQGRPTYTEARLFTYLQQFERDFARSQRTIIDATEGGVLKRGATPMPLAEAIERFCTRALPQKPAHPGMRWDRVDAAIDSLQRRRAEAEEIGQITLRTLPLLEQVLDAIGDTPRTNALIARIDPLRSRMNELSSAYELLLQLSQPAEIRRYQADRRIAAESLDGPARQRRQVQRDLENVRAVSESAREFVRLMDATIERMRSFASRRSAGRAA
jgi:hypothetical protein